MNVEIWLKENGNEVNADHLGNSHKYITSVSATTTDVGRALSMVYLLIAQGECDEFCDIADRNVEQDDIFVVDSVAYRFCDKPLPIFELLVMPQI
jgi:hypothetical protein